MIRVATPQDANDIFRVETACFSHTLLSLRSIRYMLRNPQSHLLVYEENRQITGYILTFCHKRSRLARHYSLAVLPEHRGKGIAAALLHHAESLCPDKAGFKLEVAVNNKTAYHIYERLGYDAKRVRKEYYEDGMDAYEMVKLR